MPVPSHSTRRALGPLSAAANGMHTTGTPWLIAPMREQKPAWVTATITRGQIRD
jgi:hypothetical protein